MAPATQNRIQFENDRVWTAQNEKRDQSFVRSTHYEVAGYWKQYYITECSLNLQITGENLVSQAEIFAQAEALSGKIRLAQSASGWKYGNADLSARLA